MRWEEFINKVVNLPVIETEMLLAGISSSAPIKVQISRWQKAGRLIQLKRGVYLLAEPYRKVAVYEPYIASLLKRPSYLSLEKALEYHNLIPEGVVVFTSVTPKRQAKFISPLGTFLYRHIKNSLFWGYTSVVVNNQSAFIAQPEKALLDLIYLNKIKVSYEYLTELRLQNLEKINLKKLIDFARRFEKGDILSSAKLMREYISTYKKGHRYL